MDYTELGAYLKEERERQGLSLDDVQQKTKISRTSLEAIEEGRIAELPHPVYAKGFIKNYAHMLGLDAEDLAGSFAQKMAIDEDLGDDTQRGKTELGPTSAKRKVPVVTLVLSLVLLTAVGWLAYDLFLASPQPMQTSSAPKYGQQQGQTGAGVGANGSAQSEASLPEQGQMGGNASQVATGPAQDETGSQVAMPGSDQNQTETETIEPVAESGTATGAAQEEPTAGETGPQNGAQAGDMGQDTVQASDQAEEQSSEQPEVEPTQPSATATQSMDTTQKHTLQIEATEACWMSARIDSKQRDLYLRPGESVTFRFQDELQIKLGNAGGVQLRYDGQAYPLDASSGEVMTVQFP